MHTAAKTRLHSVGGRVLLASLALLASAAITLAGPGEATAAFPVCGTSFRWVSALGPEFGQADVYVDGLLNWTVDLYDASVRWRHPVTVEGLANGRHEVSITVLGTRSILSTGNAVLFDGAEFP